MTECERPPISVPVSTVQGWPEIAPNLGAVVESVRAVGGEVVLTDRSGSPAPSPEEIGPAVVWLSYPGESVFQLRGRGYKAARGEIVVITEDHVRVPAMLWLLYSEGVGQFIGSVAGPGDSPGKVQ
jgi:hypothetical protein